MSALRANVTTAREAALGFERNRIATLITVASVLLGTVAGCSTTGSDGALPDASPCPPTAPAIGTQGCGDTVFYPVCEYGNPRCPVALSCNQNIWSSYLLAQSCVTSAPGCPSSFSTAQTASSCVVDATCTYPEGRCGCMPCFPAGADAGTGWSCAKWVTPAGCPDPAPLVGTACSMPNQICDYGWNACTVPSLGDRLACDHGYWSAEYESQGACDSGAIACGQ